MKTAIRQSVRRTLAVFFSLVLLATLFTGFTASAAGKSNGILAIKEQGAFSSGGTVTQPINGTYDATKSFTDNTRAGNTASMTSDALDAKQNGNSKDYMPGDQAWYTHFRIGRQPPERYPGSQFPAGEEAQNQFFRMMTPNTGSYNQELDAKALSAVLQDVKDRTGHKSIYMTHSQGGGVGWDTDMKNVAAIVAIEPGSTPARGSKQYNAMLKAKIPVVIYYGDYIDNGPKDLMSTGFWKNVRDTAREFAKNYNADGGDATVVNLPDIGITGNSHFMFEEMNNKQIADNIEAWLIAHHLG